MCNKLSPKNTIFFHKYLIIIDYQQVENCSMNNLFRMQFCHKAKKKIKLDRTRKKQIDKLIESAVYKDF